MVLTESDLIKSLLAQPLYLSQAMQEIAPDDTADMMIKFGRKGKSTEKQLNRIQGTSDGLFAERAKELKIKAVSKSKH